MVENFEEFVENLQKEIIEKEIKDHNERIVKLCYNPKNWGKPSKEEITIFDERRGGPENYFLGFYFEIEKDIIRKANFLTDGCGVMIAIGSQVTILIEGKSILFAESLSIEDIDRALMGIPTDEKHCLNLAIKTLKSVIEKYKAREII
ncbi:hypothetical protein LCGC14_0290870 [marine sediment metagenome]|uniref:NIF system FeS cluster assembly NifU N-terminal domain-containing protein n=1 Tax=marine sediment metagenome TaxID=412755 RepID=A0A0F9WZ22_9ZZZZ|nr:hypothetical protein [archaeon]